MEAGYHSLDRTLPAMAWRLCQLAADSYSGNLLGSQAGKTLHVGVRKGTMATSLSTGFEAPVSTSCSFPPPIMIILSYNHNLNY
jgi:hypothetical protein